MVLVLKEKSGIPDQKVHTIWGNPAIGNYVVLEQSKSCHKLFIKLKRICLKVIK